MAPPIADYYKGSGTKVMKGMQKRYGGEEGKRIFYATANARGMNRPGKNKGKKKKRK